MSANSPTSTSDNTAESNARAGNGGTGNYTERKDSRKSDGASLRADLASLKSDLDALLSRASTLSERELSEAYARMMSRFGSMRIAAKGMAAEAGRQFNEGMDKTTEYVKERPMQSLGIAAGVGLVLGLLLGRR